MKNYLFILFATTVLLQACKENVEENPTPESLAKSTAGGSSKWVQLPDIKSWGYSTTLDPDGFAFSIGDKGYLYGGSFEARPFNEYNTLTQVFNEKGPLPSFQASIRDAAAFSIGSMGYAGTGEALSGGGDRFSTGGFNQYDSQTDTWIQKARLPITLMGAVGFSINGKGYIAIGVADSLVENELHDYDRYILPSKSIFEYSPSSNCWVKKANFPGETRHSAVVFTIGDKAYVATGLSYQAGNSPGTTPLNDLWEYDPKIDKWTRKADFPGMPRFDAVGFSIGSNGYIGTGTSFNSSGTEIRHKDFWEYSASTNSWKRTDDFPGGERAKMVSFSSGSKAYVAAGVPYAVDFWEFNPSK